MHRRQSRRVIAAISSAVLAALLVRRTPLLRSVLLPADERWVLPLGDRIREAFVRGQDTVDTNDARMIRKVGRNRRISVGGKLYGPLEQDLVGKQVEVEEQDGMVVVWSDSAEVGRFEQQRS